MRRAALLVALAACGGGGDAGDAPDPDSSDESQAEVVVTPECSQASEGVVLAGTPLLEVADPSDLEVVVAVLTSDAVRIPLGAPSSLERWGGAAPLEGRVLVEMRALTWRGDSNSGNTAPSGLCQRPRRYVSTSAAPMLRLSCSSTIGDR